MSTIEDSKVRFRSVAAIVTAILGVGVAVVGGIWKVATLTADTNNQIRQLSTDVNDVRTNSYTLSKASEVALRQAIENPGIRVPDPRDPTRIIVVDGAITRPH